MITLGNRWSSKPLHDFVLNNIQSAMNHAAVQARAYSPNKARDGTQAASWTRDVFIETCQIDVLCRPRTPSPSHDGARLG